MAYLSAAGKKSKLHFLPKGGSWTAKTLKKHCRGLFTPGLKVVMDNAGAHGPLKAELMAHGVQVVPHPPWSPDLNPIENLWGTLKQKVQQRGPLRGEALQKALEEEWAAIKSADFLAYATSMQDRLRAVVESGGQHTKY
jgi:transposase